MAGKWRNYKSYLGALIVLLGLGAAFFASSSAVAHGHDLAAARALFDKGDFAQADAAGEALDTADGWAVAARALLVEAAYLAPLSDRETLLFKAEAAARQALRRDPDNSEAMLHLVIALGYRARIEGRVQAHSHNLGREAKNLIDRVLKLEPENPWAYSALGGWNGEIVHTGGSFLGGIFYGASLRKFREAFDKSLSLAPRNLPVIVEYAKMLLNLSIPRYKNEAKSLLEQAMEILPQNAFEVILQTQARSLLEAINSGDQQRLEDTLKACTPFAH